MRRKRVRYCKFQAIQIKLTFLAKLREIFVTVGINQVKGGKRYAARLANTPCHPGFRYENDAAYAIEKTEKGRIGASPKIAKRDHCTIKGAERRDR